MSWFNGGLFNAEISEGAIGSFCAIHILKRWIKENYMQQKSWNPTCIKIILTKSSNQFQAFPVLETGSSDFH